MFKKVLCLLLALALMMTAFVGCSSSKPAESTAPAADAETAEDAEAAEEEAPAIDMEGDPYEVNYLYMVAMEGADQQKVNEAVNELTKKEINMTVNMMPMTFGTYNNQISLMLSSGEPLDIFPGMAAQFATYIESQYIVNAADYKAVTKDIYEVLGEDADAGWVGDFLVGFSNVKERSYPAGLVCRKDIFDETGFTLDDFKADNQYGCDFDKVTELFAKVKELYPDMICLDGTSTLGLQTESYGDNMGNVFGYLEGYGQTTTVTNWFESEEYKMFAEINRDWFTKGYTSQDIAVNVDSGETKMRAGNCFSFITNVKPNTDIEKLAQTTYEVVIVPLSVPMKHTNAVTADLLCVANAAKDKTKAWQFMNWSYISGEFNDLINWGVKDLDWVETEDGMAAYPEGVDGATVGYHNDFGFIYPNQMCGHPWTGNVADIWDVYAEYNGNTRKSQAFGFMFDQTKVADQIATCNDVYNQYYKDVGFGAVDVEEGIKKMNDALYGAGLQDIIDEKQAQLDAWLASK